MLDAPRFKCDFCRAQQSLAQMTVVVGTERRLHGEELTIISKVFQMLSLTTMMTMPTFADHAGVIYRGAAPGTRHGAFRCGRQVSDRRWCTRRIDVILKTLRVPISKPEQIAMLVQEKFTL